MCLNKSGVHALCASKQAMSNTYKVSFRDLYINSYRNNTVKYQYPTAALNSDEAAKSPMLYLWQNRFVRVCP